MRKITLNLAISLDGRIVDENNGYGWIKGDGSKRNDTNNQFDFGSFVNDCDTIIFGKIAYDDIPIETLDSFSEKEIIVLTNCKEKPARNNVEYFSGDLSKYVQSLKTQERKNIWIFGGASVCNILIKTNLIDEYIIGIIPIIVGKGTRLFHDDNPMLELKLKECAVTEGITILTYTRRKLVNKAGFQ